MRNNDWERHIARALELGTYRAELRPEDTARLLDRARDQRIAGKWEGYARQTAARGTLIKPSPNLMEHAAGQFESGTDGRANGWPALLKMLDRMDPSYRD